MGKTVALLVAAGSGNRAGGPPKQYRLLGGKTLLAHAIDSVCHPAIDAVQVVIGADQLDAYRTAIGARVLPEPVIGGPTRMGSVRNGLEALAAAGDVERVLIHDAARPFAPLAVWERLIAGLDDADAVVPALPAVDSMARGDTILGASIPRDRLVRVQTPQGFRLAAIREAHAAWTGDEASDDSQVARAAGLRVVIVAGDPALEKFTYDEDFHRAARERLIVRTGFGFDVHAFAEGRDLWLGGILVAHDRGLAGHSDADVALHALTDAILGALGAGDIGDHFPPSDPRWRGVTSATFLDHARRLVDQAGGLIDHVDVTLVCEAPRVGPHRSAMRERIAALLRIDPRRTSVKATTTERLGFTGRGEGIAAQAVATLRLPEDR